MYHQIQMLAGQVQHLLLAQDGGDPPEDTPQGSGFLILLLGFLVFMLMFSGRGAKKRKEQRSKMITGIRKYAEVITMGGICGAVVEIETEEREDGEDPFPTHFVLEVDSGSGSRIRVLAGAIREVLDDNTEENL